MVYGMIKVGKEHVFLNPNNSPAISSVAWGWSFQVTVTSNYNHLP